MLLHFKGHGQYMISRLQWRHPYAKCHVWRVHIGEVWQGTKSRQKWLLTLLWSRDEGQGRTETQKKKWREKMKANLPLTAYG